MKTHLEVERMALHRIVRLAAIVAGSIVYFASLAADAATLQQALAMTPIQAHVEYTTPSKEEAAECTIRPEKEDKSTAWIVRDPQGVILRRFADSNNDNTVDQWCYYLDGLEVYRDIDSNFNGKADQYRWFHMAGTRWGLDKNEDGRIDAWRMISTHEVAEQVVLALKSRDAARFNLLLMTSNELNQLGLDKAKAESLASSIKAASAGFGTLAEEQKVVSRDSRYVDFGSARPATIPAGTNGSKNDFVVCENASALVQTGEKHEQIALGTLVRVGDTWKLVDLPAVGADGNPQGPRFLVAANTTTSPDETAVAGPTEAMQKLMAELERLDRQADGLAPDKLAENIGQRADLLTRLAEATEDAELRDQWYRQLADMLSVAIQSNTYPEGAARMDALEKQLIDAKADDNLIAHIVFQRMWAKYVVDQEQPNANAAQIQTQWLKDLEDFVTKYPKSSDAAEALLQLGMYQEFVGQADEARKWYQQLVSNFPNAAPTSKAQGALRRLTSVGTQIRLRGQDFQGGAVDLSAAPYRGKPVLIHYWATWSDRCKEDMIVLKDFYAKKGGREFEIIGVCLDSSAPAARQYLSQNRFPWKHVYEPGGVDGRLANEMGIMTLPLMILVDQDGRVVSHNIQLGELETQLAKLQNPTPAGANAQRGGPTAR
jgi:hypothetical protein